MFIFSHKRKDLGTLAYVPLKKEAVMQMLLTNSVGVMELGSSYLSHKDRYVKSKGRELSSLRVKSRQAELIEFTFIDGVMRALVKAVVPEAPHGELALLIESTPSREDFAVVNWAI
jgi:hypothetical protein